MLRLTSYHLFKDLGLGFLKVTNGSFLVYPHLCIIYFLILESMLDHMMEWNRANRTATCCNRIFDIIRKSLRKDIEVIASLYQIEFLFTHNLLRHKLLKYYLN